MENTARGVFSASVQRQHDQGTKRGVCRIGIDRSAFYKRRVFLAQALCGFLRRKRFGIFGPCRLQLRIARPRGALHRARGDL